MKQGAGMLRKPGVNRRAFLYGAGTLAIGLPFLEGLPERSAWAADKPPVFSLFIVAACGVVGKKFFPDATGPITTSSLAALTDKATSVLAPHAANLLFVKNINFPMGGPTSCGHAQGLCQSLTAAPSLGNANTAYSTGISADMVIAKAVNPSAGDPLTLYAGNKKGYIAERISFRGSGAGQVRAADDNPYTLYAKLLGLTQSGGAADPAAAELLTTRKSVNDLVRSQLTALLNNPKLSAADRQRAAALRQHSRCGSDDGQQGLACSKDGLSTTQLDALKSGLAFKMDGMIEDVAKLHLELVALSFACDFNRLATLQHGEGTDGTKYNVPSNASLGWPFHHISHRVQSDSERDEQQAVQYAHPRRDSPREQRDPELRHWHRHWSNRGHARLRAAAAPPACAF